MAKEHPKSNWRPGEKLTASHVNITAAAAARMENRLPGSFNVGIAGNTFQTESPFPPHVQVPMQVIALKQDAEGNNLDSQFTGYIRNYNKSLDTWGYDGQLFDIDARAANAELEPGMIITAYYDQQRGAFIPATPTGSGGQIWRVELIGVLNPGSSAAAKFLGTGVQIQIHDPKYKNYGRPVEQFEIFLNSTIVVDNSSSSSSLIGGTSGQYEIIGSSGLHRRGITNEAFAPGGTGSITLNEGGTLSNVHLDHMHGGQGISSGKDVVAVYYVGERKWAIENAECEDESSGSSGSLVSSSSSLVSTQSSPSSSDSSLSSQSSQSLSSQSSSLSSHSSSSQSPSSPSSRGSSQTSSFSSLSTASSESSSSTSSVNSSSTSSVNSSSTTGPGDISAP